MVKGTGGQKVNLGIQLGKIFFGGHGAFNSGDGME